MNIIKFCLLYLYKLIILNPWKLAFMILSWITWTFAGTMPDNKKTISVADSLHIDGNYQYIYRNIKKNQSNIDYDIISSPTPLKVVNSKIELSEYNEINSILWAAFLISIIVLFILLVLSKNDDDCSWELDDCFDWALSWFVKCDIQNDEYYYHAFGKLLSKRDILTNDGIYVSSIRKLKMKPNYISKDEQRNKSFFCRTLY